MAGSRPENAVSASAASFAFPRSRRLIKTSEFGAVISAGSSHCLRASSRFFSAGALICEPAGRLRFGVTVGKRNAHRSVDRALIKRLLREAARKQAPHLGEQLRAQDMGLDVSLRLKAPIASVPGRETGVGALKAELRADIEQLFRQLSRRIGACGREEKA